MLVHDELMGLALEQARKSGDDVPVGAVIVDADGNLLAAAHNSSEITNDPSGHAELIAIREAASKLADWRLENCTLVVTLEPCVMCAGAIVAARIPKVIFGAFDEKVGAAGSAYDILRDARLGRPVEVIPGVLADECSQLLRDFFESKRP